jgi:hypothetical protein
MIPSICWPFHSVERTVLYSVLLQNARIYKAFNIDFRTTPQPIG